MMFDPNTITTQQSQIQYQQPQQAEKDKGQDQKDTFSPFCYANVNMIHKITPNTTQTHNSTVNMSQLTDDKCYITQPFSYNYTLVNQNLLTQNAISNITFKCEVCGLMFAHLSLLNHHKKVHHGQTDQGQAQQQQITVQVQQPQQQATQIQIVSADRIRFSCEECGLTFNTQTDLKSHKIQSHQPQQQQQQFWRLIYYTLKKNPGPNPAATAATAAEHAEDKELRVLRGAPPPGQQQEEGGHEGQVRELLERRGHSATDFCGGDRPDTSVKFEESTGTQTQSTLGTQNSIPIGVKNNHPVKRRGVTSVTKCTKCNGSGIIFIGGSKHQQNNVDKPFHCNICNVILIYIARCDICGSCFNQATHLKNHAKVHSAKNLSNVTFAPLGSLIGKFALKRHRNIHEKYGRTKPNPPASSTDDTQTNNTTTDSVNTSTVTTVATATQDSADHEEIVEAKFEEKFETVDPNGDMNEEMTDISELQVQLQ
ncbi:hypothetical protein NQ318_016506 [Aromia moschata]|uniref:C2H2-type domain-containing protein n=1 Tax=Aromia moschata TaxID=1265417 RepID=A0AAV8YZ94_9CUCU|nr:hypothetical protein NQ318_016506 [Aromia moschata]